jgi:hypothetical protein
MLEKQNNYFPLQVGNYWNYKIDYYGGIETYQNIIESFIGIDEHIYYEMYSSIYENTKSYRMDTLQRILKYNFISISDDLVADFQMQPGDSILIDDDSLSPTFINEENIL